MNSHVAFRERTLNSAASSRQRRKEARDACARACGLVTVWPVAVLRHSFRQVLRLQWWASAAAVGFVLLTVAGSASGQAGGGLVARAFGTAQIDGDISPGEWDGAFTTLFLASIADTFALGQLSIMNDNTNLYVKVQFPRPVKTLFQQGWVRLHLSSKSLTSTSLQPGDDLLFDFSQLGFVDAFATASPCADSLCPATDPSQEGTAAFGDDGSSFIYEFSHPLNSGDPDHDIKVRAGDLFAIDVFTSAGPSSSPPRGAPFVVEVAGPVQLSLSVAQPGNRVTVGLDVRNAPQNPEADLYLGALLPDGRTLVFFNATGSVVATTSLAQPQSFRPMSALPAGGRFIDPALFTAGVPAGQYVVFAALVRSGAFSDNQIHADDILAIDRRTLNIP